MTFGAQLKHFMQGKGGASPPSQRRKNRLVFLAYRIADLDCYQANVASESISRSRTKLGDCHGPTEVSSELFPCFPISYQEGKTV